MAGTFQFCTNLNMPPQSIPETVTDLRWAFQSCYVLNGLIEINGCTGITLSNGMKDYDGCFVDACINSKLTLTRTINDSLLDDIIEDANNANISAKK